MFLYITAMIIFECIHSGKRNIPLANHKYTVLCIVFLYNIEVLYSSNGEEIANQLA